MCRCRAVNLLNDARIPTHMIQVKFGPSVQRACGDLSNLKIVPGQCGYAATLYICFRVRRALPTSLQVACTAVTACTSRFSLNVPSHRGGAPSAIARIVRAADLRGGIDRSRRYDPAWRIFFRTQYVVIALFTFEAVWEIAVSAIDASETVFPLQGPTDHHIFPKSRRATDE